MDKHWTEMEKELDEAIAVEEKINENLERQLQDVDVELQRLYASLTSFDLTKYEIENPNPNFDDEMRQIAALKERVERELPELKRRKTNVKALNAHLSSNKKYFEGEVKKAKVKLELQRRKELQIKEVEEQINLKKSEASKLRNKFEALQMECDKMDQQFRQEIKESKKFKKPMQLSGSSTSSIMEETKNLKSSRKLREPKIEPLDNISEGADEDPIHFLERLVADVSESQLRNVDSGSDSDESFFTK